MTPLISMTGVSKVYGNTVALDNVSFELLPGQVHGLMGENGAGKSTLMKILAGVVNPDAGSITKSGSAVQLRNPREALEQGISTVFQELSLLSNLSIAENMFLGKEPLSSMGAVDRREMVARSSAALGELGLDLDPTTLVSRLSVAQQQFVEIARGISANADVVILDEPTAALNAADVGVLNRHIQQLKSKGKAIVYISHRMEEIFQICDVVTVLKDGRYAGSEPIGALTPKSLIAMMVGRELGELFPERAEHADAKVLELKSLQLTSSSKPIDLHVRAGEIVGLAGLEGQGQREILRSIIGRYQAHAGSLTVLGNELEIPLNAEDGVRKLQAMGVGFVPEDRKDEGLFLDMSIDHNLSIGLQAARRGFKVAGNFRKAVDELIARMTIKARTSALPVGALSGGNQQKVLLGRYLLIGAGILLIEEPTRGVDVGAKAEIYRLLREFVLRGGAAIVLSRETIELIGLCDRLYVIHGSQVVSQMHGSEATEHDIIDAAFTAAQRH